MITQNTASCDPTTSADLGTAATASTERPEQHLNDFRSSWSRCTRGNGRGLFGGDRLNDFKTFLDFFVIVREFGELKDKMVESE